MNKKINYFKLFFGAASGTIVIFITLPVLVTIFGSSTQDLQRTISDQEVLRTIYTTFTSAFIATVIGLVFGVPLAYLLARYRFHGKIFIEGIIDIPIIIPHTAAGIALLMVFGSKGILGQPLSKISIFFVDSIPGIVVGMLFVSLPFLVRVCREAFRQIDIELERMALMDGANHWQVFFAITIPIAWRGILSGAMMMWARGISEFGAIVILAYHPKIISTLIFERFEGYGLDAAKPLAVLLIFIALIIFILMRMLFMPEEGDLEYLNRRKHKNNH